MNETRILADFVSRVTYKDLPVKVIDKTKELILDQLGCQLAGSTLPLSKAIYEYVNECRGQQTESTVINFGLKTAAKDAAFANANFGHAFMGDDTDSVCHAHFGSILIPAALAIGEKEGKSGKDLITAIVAGYEVASRIGAAGRTANMRGFHPGPIFAPFGVAASCGKMMGFNEHQMLDAIGVAGSQCSGLMEYSISGGSVNRLHSGTAAYSGIRSALMTQKGFNGPPTVIEGVRGFLHAYSGESYPEEITRGLGREFRVLLIDLKPYCCCGTAVSGLDALSKITGEHPIQNELIDNITVYVPQSVYRMIGSITEPTDITSAQFSGNYCTALRLVKGGNSFREFTRENLADPVILALASKTKFVLDDSMAKTPASHNPSRVVIKLTNGTVYEEIVHAGKGSVLNPMTKSEIAQKFRDFASESITEAKIVAVIKAVNELENIDNISVLAHMLTAS